MFQLSGRKWSRQGGGGGAWFYLQCCNNKRGRNETSAENLTQPPQKKNKVIQIIAERSCHTTTPQTSLNPTGRNVSAAAQSKRLIEWITDSVWSLLLHTHTRTHTLNNQQHTGRKWSLLYSYCVLNKDDYCIFYTWIICRLTSTQHHFIKTKKKYFVSHNLIWIILDFHVSVLGFEQIGTDPCVWFHGRQFSAPDWNKSIKNC